MNNANYDFDALLQKHGIELPRCRSRRCSSTSPNSAIGVRHCHVDSSPARTEKMSREGVERIVEILKSYPQIKNTTSRRRTGAESGFRQLGQRATGLDKARDGSTQI